MLVSPADVVAKTKATIKECSVRDVHQCIGAGTIIIDIREPAEFERGHRPGSLHIPRGVLEFEILPALGRCNLAVSPEECDIILYCGTGGRSALAAKSMDDMGFRNVRSMDGGIVAWAEARLTLDIPTA